MSKLKDYFAAGNVVISRYLLQNYKRIGLDEKKMMILILIISDYEAGSRTFDLSKYVEFTTIDSREIFEIVDFLKDNNFIETVLTKEEDGSYCEYVSLDPLINRLLAEQKTSVNTTVETRGLIDKFEQAFSRPITPVEHQTIMKWIEEGYTEEQITFALKQAMYADVRKIRYVDKVLMELDNVNER